MTVIVGVTNEEGTFLGCDTTCFHGHEKTQLADGKIKKLAPDFLLGGAGQLNILQAIFESFHFPNRGFIKDNQKFLVKIFVPALVKFLNQKGLADVNGSNITIHGYSLFLVAISTDLFRISTDGCVIRADEGYDAVGCGAPYALGSLYTTRGVQSGHKRVKAAIKSASAHHTHVGHKMHIHQV